MNALTLPEAYPFLFPPLHGRIWKLILQSRQYRLKNRQVEIYIEALNGRIPVKERQRYGNPTLCGIDVGLDNRKLYLPGWRVDDQILYRCLQDHLIWYAHLSSQDPAGQYQARQFALVG
jgi:hypothetical protein